MVEQDVALLVQYYSAVTYFSADHFLTLRENLCMVEIDGTIKAATLYFLISLYFSLECRPNPDMYFELSKSK